MHFLFYLTKKHSINKSSQIPPWGKNKMSSTAPVVMAKKVTSCQLDNSLIIKCMTHILFTNPALVRHRDILFKDVFDIKLKVRT